MKTRGTLAVAIILSLAVAGCDTPFANSADRFSYALIAERQRQALESTSDVKIGREMIPVPVTPEDYRKVPPTDNRLPVTPLAVETQPDAAGAPQSAPATTQAGSQPAAQTNPLDALLARTPPIDLAHQGELPEFPSPAPTGTTRKVFDLYDAFNYSLDHSREYQSRKEDLYIAALNVGLARHDFEPRFGARSVLGVTGQGEGSSDLNAALSAAQSVSLHQRLPMGGEIIAEGLVQSVNEMLKQTEDTASASAILSANIPLLRGAGLVAQENLIQTERSLIYEVRDFERFRRGFLVQVASVYFSLVNQRAQVFNRFRSVRSYIFITQRTAALFEAGVGRRRVTQLDLQRAQQSEFQARNDLSNAIQQYELSVDTFKILLGMPAEQPLDVKAEYLNITPPDVSEAAAVAVAERLRLDLQTARDQVDDATRQTKVASNQLLPDLNVNARMGAVTNPQDRTFIANNVVYGAGFTFDWPLDRVAERNAYRASLINLSRAKRSVETQEDQVAVNVRDALRRVQQQQYLVSLQRSNIDLATRRKEFADIQFKNGEIDNRDYLDAETALLDAQNRFAQAISSLEIATLQYLRDTDQLRVDATGKLLMPAK